MAEDWISKLTSSIYTAQQNRANFISGAEGRALQKLKNIESTIHKAFEGVDFNDENQIVRTEKYINNQIGEFKRQYPNQALLIDGLEADSQGIVNHFRDMQANYNNDLVNLKSAINESNLLAEGGLDAAFSATSFADKTLQESGLASFLGVDSMVSENVINDQVLQAIKRNEKIISDFNAKYLIGSPDLSGVQGKDGGVLGANRFWNENLLPMSFFSDTQLQEELSKSQTILPFLKNEYISNRYEHKVTYVDQDGKETVINTFLNPDEKKTVEMFLNDEIDYAQFAQLNGKIEKNKKSNQNEILSNTQLLNQNRQQALVNIDQYFANSPRILSIDESRNGVISDGTNHISKQGDIVITSYQDFITKVINNPDLSQDQKQQYISAFSNQNVEAFELTDKGQIVPLYDNEEKTISSTYRLGALTDILNNTEAQIMENSQKYLSYAPDTDYVYDRAGNIVGSSPTVLDPKPMEDLLNDKGQNYISFDPALQGKLDEMYLQKGFKGLPETSETRPYDFSGLDRRTYTGETEATGEQAFSPEELTASYEGESMTQDEFNREVIIRAKKSVIDTKIKRLEERVEEAKLEIKAEESRGAKYKAYTKTKEDLKNAVVDIRSGDDFQRVENVIKFLNSDKGDNLLHDISFGIDYYLREIEDMLSDIERGESIWKIGETQRSDVESEIKDAFDILKDFSWDKENKLYKHFLRHLRGGGALKDIGKLNADLNSKFQASSKDNFDKEINASIKSFEKQIKNIKNKSIKAQDNISELVNMLKNIESAITKIEDNDILWEGINKGAKKRKDDSYSQVKLTISWMLNYLKSHYWLEDL